jgi:hypothetical protein
MESVYKVIELIGTSSESWEKATQNAVTQAAKTLRDIRIVEVIKLDAKVSETGEIVAYRSKIRLSFKFVREE